MTPQLWKTFNANLDIDLGEEEDLPEMFGVLIRRAPHIHTLSIKCSWMWTDERLESLATALCKLNALSTLSLLLPDTPQGRLSGGEYAPVIRLLAEKGGHLRLRRLSIDHLARPNSPIITFLATQHHLKHLEYLNFTPGRAYSIPDMILPHLEKLSTHSPSVVSAFVPHRPMSSLYLEGDAAADITFISALEQACGASLELDIDPGVTNDGLGHPQYLDVIRRLSGRPTKVKTLRLGSFVFDAASHFGLEKLTSLEELVFWQFQGTPVEFETWVKVLPRSVQTVVILGDDAECTRMADGYESLFLCYGYSLTPIWV